MKKKIFYCIVLLTIIFNFFGFSKTTKPKNIKFLAWAQSSGSVEAFKYIPSDSTILEHYTSDTILTCTVPPAPKADALFFETWTQVMLGWSDYSKRFANGRLYIQLISEVIPDNISISYLQGIPTVRETNFANNYSIYYNRERRNLKMILRRDNFDWWNIIYTDTEGPVPDNIALDIINNIIDEGFDIHVWVKGDVQGLNFIYFLPIQIEVTCITKN
jgi:hypothetical protein